MIRKIAVFLLCISTFFSCQKEIISVLLLRGEWNITELTVKKDFSGKTSEYTINNAGTFHFDKKEKGKLTQAQDTSLITEDFTWRMENKTITINYEDSEVIETWTIIRKSSDYQEWEITQNFTHESGGLSSKEIRYRKIVLEK
jgi:hypothetical protein